MSFFTYYLPNEKHTICCGYLSCYTYLDIIYVNTTKSNALDIIKPDWVSKWKLLLKAAF